VADGSTPLQTSARHCRMRCQRDVSLQEPTRRITFLRRLTNRPTELLSLWTWKKSRSNRFCGGGSTRLESSRIRPVSSTTRTEDSGCRGMIERHLTLGFRARAIGTRQLQTGRRTFGRQIETFHATRDIGFDRADQAAAAAFSFRIGRRFASLSARQRDTENGCGPFPPEA
jgi:hypothetical protein